jgi:adenine-specific DNA-methyltransferase
MASSKLRILNEDFLNYQISTEYHFIVGNPPYFVMKKSDVDKSFYDYFDGRPNIFILFIVKSLSLLKENGILAFVLPQNFLNCLYYNKTRQYINNYFTILQILECDDEYLDTKQKTIIVIIQKKKQTILLFGKQQEN